MSEAKHTKGPWMIGPDEEGDPSQCISASGFDIATVWGGYLAADADARLIASAPELLEALEWMVANDETNEGDTPMPEYGGRSWNEINAYWLDGLNRARAAIAKARGQA
jgi:hypothetical protein